MTTTRAWGCATAVGMCLLAWAAAAAAQTNECVDASTCKVATDRPAAILVYPRVEVNADQGIDTVIQLTNTSEAPVGVRCSYLNANGHCSSTGEPCRSSSDCGGSSCVQGWSETDFRITLTKLQPLSWNASQGLSFLPCDFLSGQAGCVQRNDGRIPPVPETPFIGELKCIEVDDSDAPIDSNDLIGEATTIRALGTALDASKYNAIGLQAIPGQNDHDNSLCLGGEIPSDTCPEAAEYAGCPQTLIMDHFFDGSTIGGSGEISNRLTLVPCGEDLLNAPGSSAPAITVQFLVFNEFEQRTSTSLRFRCFGDRNLSDIANIFSLGTQGTPAGQTRISGVGTIGSANGVLALLEEFRPCDDGPDQLCGAAVNLHQQGRRILSDVLRLP
jgi:hypothetical protein